MIAPVFIEIRAALRIRCAAELAAPDDERVVQHAALFEILDQGRGGLVHILSDHRQAVGQSDVMIPVAMIKLDKTHAAFCETSREQAVAREGAGLGDIIAIHGKRCR